MWGGRASARDRAHARPHVAVPPRDPGAGALPVELTSFVGRRRELADVKRLLASSRLLTLTGPGGVGKTRLAARAAQETGRQYPGGTWFVELAPVVDPPLVIQAVFATLGLQDRSSAAPIETLASYLADRQPLLILDNAEQVREATAVLAGSLLRSCPDLRILVTSRQALGVTGEVIVAVPPLSLPADDATDAAWTRSDAVALFAERAAAAQPGFELDATTGPRVLDLCERLGGLPLALELAAVRLRALGLDALDRGVRARLDVLGRGDVSAAPRQRTLEAAIDWSFQLLAPAEQLLWARLSVFAGGFALDAAAEVCAGDGIEADDIGALVGRLVEQSV